MIKPALMSILSSAVLILLLSNPPQSNLTSPTPAVASVQFVVLPEDHIFHSSFTREWWYLNLQIIAMTPSGQQRNLAYLISFSRLGSTNGLLTSRFQQNTNEFSQNTHPGIITSYLDGGFITKFQGNTPNIFMDFRNKFSSNTYQLYGSSPQIGQLGLILTERTPSSSPLLWNCTGQISVFSPNDTYYYSIPDLDISGGIIDIDGQPLNIVAGKAWADHQWFNSSPPSDWKGHYWGSWQVNTTGDPTAPGPHSSGAFVTQYFSDGPRYSYWIKRNFDGTNSCGSDLQVIPSVSPDSYPSNLTIRFSSPGSPTSQLSFTSLSPNQVFIPPFGPEFYEPAAQVSGRYFSSQTVSGFGFFETSMRGQPPITQISTPTPTLVPTLKPIPQPPAYITPSDSIPSGSTTISWQAVPGATYYYYRIDDTTDNAECSGPNDICTMVQYQNTSVSYTFEAGKSYRVWVHAGNESGYSNPLIVNLVVSPNTPTPTPISPTQRPTSTPKPTTSPTPRPTSSPTQSADSLIVRAWGTPANNIYPRLQFFINGTMVKSILVTANPRNYRYDAVTPFTLNQVQLKFVNDLSTSTNDRNLYIDYLQLQNSAKKLLFTKQIEDPTVYSFTDDPLPWCVQNQTGFRESQDLYCNGGFRFP